MSHSQPSSELKLLLFGDQGFGAHSHLKGLLAHRSNAVLEDFLVKAYNAIRLGISKLSQQVRNDLPRFTCVDDLLLWQPGSRHCLPLDMAVTTMYQLGLYITQADASDYAPDKTRVVGLCTGALAAAAVSCSRSTLDLVPMAVDAVAIAFRVGMRVAARGDSVAPSRGAEESWSFVIRGPAGPKAVQKFCKETLLPLTSRPYVSAYLPSGVTVSGPPASLAKFAKSAFCKDLKIQSIPIYGLYHAPHLYSANDLAELILPVTATEAAGRTERLPLLSSTGVTVESRNFAALLEVAIAQILVQPIRWAEILQELEGWIQAAAPQSFRIIPIATRNDALVYTALKQTPLAHLVPADAAARPHTSIETSNANPQKPKLAIIGMSCRIPGAQDNEAFWDLLYRGLDVHKEVPPLHWDAKTHVDPTGATKNTSATPFGCWLDDPAAFDARFFSISPREAPQIDPAQRLALMTAYEAIEQAGIVPDATPSTRRDRVGVFYGVTSNDWMETNSAQNIDTYFIPGGNRAFIPGRINYCFKFSGPSYAVDTACSSSLAGIHLACNSLWRGDIDTAIAGGTNVLTNPDFTSGLDRGHFLSRTGNCKTFDDGADGYCRGEGIGTIIIKRLDDAIADKDPILGLILGAATNHSAESESITRPHSGAQRAIFSKILNQGGIDPYDVGYVEMHGTGTQAGDAGEMSSVLETFAPPLSQVPRGRTANEALFIGSAKSNIGHGEAASGVSALVKVLLMMQMNTIPPHCGIKTKINQKFPTDLQERNVHIAMTPTPWVQATKPRRAFVNNFSAAGGNTALLIEDAPMVPEPPCDDVVRTHLIGVSAKNGVSLQGNLKSLLAYVKQHPNVSLGQLSYTTTARRQHHQHRVMLAANNANEAASQMEVALRDGVGMTRPKSAPKMVFAFTGQGAQYPGMGKQLFETFSLFRSELHRLDQVCQSLGFPSVLPVVQSAEKDLGGFSPTCVQLANTIMQIALAKLWASWNLAPDAVVGHSLGEYAALNVAGVLSDCDTIYLVGERAKILEEKCTRGTHSMLVVMSSVEKIATVLRGQAYEIACINSPIETVIAGPNGTIYDYKTMLTDAGMKATPLKVPYAFHSSQVDPILSEFKEVAGSVVFSKARIPVLSPLGGNIITDADGFGPEYLAKHTRMTVNMQDALLQARTSKLVSDQTIFLEIGPHPAITGMIKPVLGQQSICLTSLQRGRCLWQTLTASLKVLYMAGSNIDWAEFQRDFTAAHRVLPLPAYSWDLKQYWMQYVNDWSLRKGDAPLVIKDTATKIESTTIHRVVEETGDAKKTHIVVEADIQRKDLAPLVQGHEVDGIPLCTPSVYADMALTLGKYLVNKYRPGQQQDLVDVSDMTISKALILRNKVETQPIQAHGDVDWATQSALVKFMSFDAKGKLQEHSRCVLHFKDRSLQTKLQAEAPKVKAKIQAVRAGIMDGTTARFNAPMVYRAIRPLARFHDDYRAIDEIVLNSHSLEAVCRLSYGNVKKGGDFSTHPAIIDSLTQSCGFTMNCNDGSDLDKEVFMNHGWGSFQIFEPIDHAKVYVTYTQMKEGADKLWHGDVYVFDGERIVAWFGQIAVILSIESGSKAQASKISSVPQPQKAAGTPGPVASASAPRPAALTPAPVAAAPDSHGKFDKALAIIAEESGLFVDDLTDATVFSDVGIDSLMGLTISARFKEELNMDLDFNALFYEYPTIGELRGYMGASVASSGQKGILAAALASLVSSGTEKALPAPPTVVDNGQFNQALVIIAEESGLAIDDLTDGTVFSDVGIDSLMGLTISARLKEELDLDLDFNALFYEHPSVGELRVFMGGFGTPVPVSESSSPSPSCSDGASTPASLATAYTPVTEQSNYFERKVDFGRVLQIIEEESGVSVEDLTDDTSFVDSGVDSLLSLVIVSRFRDELGIDIQHESLFLECPHVSDLRAFLCGAGGTTPSALETPVEPTPADPVPAGPAAVAPAKPVAPAQLSAAVPAANLAARKEAVDAYVKSYTDGFMAPVPDASAPMPAENENVVLVTGGTGSLGGHLVYHLAQLPDVQKVICLNREGKDGKDAWLVQQKAMRKKGIRFPESLRHKLVIYRTDAAQCQLGLSDDEYSTLTSSVTHLIHQAWPMSAKRPLAGFESQFQVMRNLINFAAGAVSRRPSQFRFGFQMVSSVGVVGRYGLGNGLERTMVPEERMPIDTVLPNGYGEAKWGCERMMDETLHCCPDNFRAMVVRLGQIAGSKTSGYWNPMEHFGFLIKSSQTLGALPEVPGDVFWTPVNDIAGTLADLVLGPQEPHAIYHIENPVGQPWAAMNAVLQSALQIPDLVPFSEWLARVRAAPQRGNPASSLLEFLEDNYLRMSCGGLVLDVRNTLEHSPTLRAVGRQGDDVVRRYIKVWEEIGYLQKVEGAPPAVWDPRDAIA